jgi:hypothetical protein
VLAPLFIAEGEGCTKSTGHNQSATT